MTGAPTPPSGTSSQLVAVGDETLNNLIQLTRNGSKLSSKGKLKELMLTLAR
jgi:hypothetical protein